MNNKTEASVGGGVGKIEMQIPREVAILDECSALCMRKRKSLIARYRSFERLPRILAFLAAGLAMAAAVLMAAAAYSGLPPAIATITASVLAVIAGLLALSSVSFFSTGQLVDAVEGAASFLSLNNKCQIERERGIANGEIGIEAIKEVFEEFSNLSSRYDRLLPMTVGNLSLPRAADLPAIRFQNAGHTLAANDADGAANQIAETRDASETMLEQIDQIIDDIKSSEPEDGDNLADLTGRRRKLSTV